MNILISFILILYFGNGFCSKKYQKDIGQDRKLCLKCFNRTEGNYTIQTINEQKLLGGPVEPLITIVTFPCEFSEKSTCTMDAVYIWDKMCMTKYRPCLSNYNMISNTSYIKKNMSLDIDLYAMKNREGYKISIKCENKIKFDVIKVFHWQNESINYREANTPFKLTNSFQSNDLSRTPLYLHFRHLNYEFITKMKINIISIDPDICKTNICRETCLIERTKLGYKCTIMISGKEVDAGYNSNVCGKTLSSNGKYDKLSLCNYYNIINKSLCTNDCLDTPNCGYVCSKVVTETSRIEDGYIGYTEQWIEGNKIGLDQVEWNQLPVDKVDINECNYSRKLCKKGKISNKISECINGKVGFTCSNGGEINWPECQSKKRISRYWQCRVDEVENIKKRLSSPTKQNETENMEYVKKFMKTINSIPVKIAQDDVMKMIGVMNIDTSHGNSMKLPPNERSIFAAHLLENMEQLSSSLSLFTNSPSIFSISNATVTVKNLLIPKNSTKLALIGRDNSNQFIDLQLTGSRKSNRHGNLTTNFIYYHKLDMIGEQKALKEQLDQSRNLLITNKTRGNATIFYKNSDIFSIKLSEPIETKINFKIRKNNKYKQSTWLFEITEECGFLDIKKGWVWSTKGCRKVNNDYCQCDHLTNFALLFSIRPINEIHLRVLEILSYFGGVVNIISLTLFLVFILAINTRDKLRVDQLNLALCLLTATVIYLFGGLLSNYNTICSLVAIASQFLFMSAFVWKLILGINVVRMVASIRYQEDWLIKYRTIFIVIGYTIPCVITAISAGVHYKDYGRVSNNVCWINSSSAAFLSFLVPVSIIIAINLIVLVYIAKVLVLNYINTRKTKVNDSNELLVFVQLLVSMGFTWIPSYLATISLTAMYVMVISFPFQGFLMFLLVVVINKENRDKVSSFLATISSKSSSTSDKTYSKTKSSTRTKTTDQNDSLLPKSNDTNGQKISIEMTNQNSEIHMTSEKC